MTTDTAVAESEAGVSEFPPWPAAEETLAANPSWRYLFVKDMPVRPPTEEEAAAYKARYDDDSFAHIYAPPEPHIVLPPSDEVAGLTEIAAGAADPAPPASDEDAWAFGADEAQHQAETTLARWTKGVRLADPETARPDPAAGVVEGAVVDDPATTRFLEAFAEDPEGERDRAQAPPATEVHHDTQVIDTGGDGATNV